MNPLIVAVISRIAAGAIGAAAVPTVSQGEPAIVPTSMEELAVQAITAVAAVAVVWVRQYLAEKKAKQEQGAK